MSDVAIEAHRLGKRYNLGQTHTGLLRHRIDRALGRLLGRRAAPPAPREAIWALRDVSFELPRGEVLGIVGRNGAGKSTLLKILSRITVPTEGRARLRGRVASLLEVGTGFHPELTGRENIFLNGTILGMTTGEIHRQFDAIVAFAELDRFIDTPVKRYSSGMYVRLAFAVAAHLDPEILLVDEVLAVGDVEFQRKCLGKMHDVAHQGRTVLFVSHNMPAVTRLCSQALLLVGGRCIRQAGANEVVRDYLDNARRAAGRSLAERSDRRGNGRLRFTDVCFEDDLGCPTGGGVSGCALNVVLSYQSVSGGALRSVVASVGVYTSDGMALVNCRNDYSEAPFASIPPVGRIRLRIPRLPLVGGTFWLNLYCEVGGEVADWIESAAELTVADGDFYGTGRAPHVRHSPMHVDHAWSVQDVREEAA